jgi:hypothetical protein
MRYRAMAGLVLLAMVGTMLAGCTDSSGTDAMLQLQEGLTDGQSLSDVQASMSDELKARMTMYPAEKMEKTASGNWVFTAKEDGAVGDIDAPFQVMLVAPGLASASTLTILFDDEKLVDSVWYTPTSVSMLKKALLGNIYEDTTAEDE